MKELFKTQIIGAGAAIPDRRVASDDLLKSIDSEKRFGIPHSFISDKIGIVERRVANILDKPSDLAIEASINAMCQSRIDALDIDLIVYCGIDRDWVEPATAHRVQDFIGAKNAYCFDVSNACHGMMNGLDYANDKIQLGKIETALICTGEKSSDLLYDVMNKLVQPGVTRSDFDKWVGTLTVGDAGGAFIVSRGKDDTGLKSMQFYSAGEHADLCAYTRNEHGIEGHMYMKSISHQIASLHKQKIKNAYKAVGWTPNDIEHLICHQVGGTPHNLLCRIAGVSVGKSTRTYPMLGNITSATMAVSMALTTHNRGDKILLLSTGSGLTIGHTSLICSFNNDVNNILTAVNNCDHLKVSNSDQY